MPPAHINRLGLAFGGSRMLLLVGGALGCASAQHQGQPALPSAHRLGSNKLDEPAKQAIKAAWGGRSEDLYCD